PWPLPQFVPPSFLQEIPLIINTSPCLDRKFLNGFAVENLTPDIISSNGNCEEEQKTVASPTYPPAGGEMEVAVSVGRKTAHRRHPL
ncbi:hypothetical protein GWI33_019195, partial [Rhynchophorus ferrugineus]